MSVDSIRFPQELLRLVLDELEPNPDEPIPVDRRRFLSQESLDRPSPPPRSCIEDIASFRLACKQFADVGAPLLFTRVVTRLSKRDLKRLEILAGWEVSKNVKRFSYLVPYFFQNPENRQSLLLPRGAYDHTHFDLTALQRKENERKQLISGTHDVSILKKAIGSFKHLQHVRVLPVADEEQQRLLRLIRQEPALKRLVDLNWTEACCHCSRTVGQALKAAQLPTIRFSYPKLSPQDAQLFSQRKMQSISQVAATLTSLTLQFEEVENMDLEIRKLSPLFRKVFQQAVNMEAIHIGFLSPQPLSLPLEDVFQRVVWRKLVALGIHGWNLHANEVRSLALRHKEKLKGLRLRRVFLRDDSMWKDVLGEIKRSMHSLEWISLTGIGYAGPPLTGAEMPEELPPGDDSSDDSDHSDSGYHSHIHANGSRSNEDPVAGSSNNHHDNYSNFEDDDFYGDADSDEERRGDMTEIEFLDLDPADDASANLPCDCDELVSADITEALEDDGTPIEREKAKRWERWVVNRCLIHGKR